jgi:hypothetical protein
MLLQLVEASYLMHAIRESRPAGGPLKPGFGLSGMIGDAEHFWQKRCCDFNIRNYRSLGRSAFAPSQPALQDA